jgi:two-component system sensor histidine kinase PilS (NtrC family)
MLVAAVTLPLGFLLGPEDLVAQRVTSFLEVASAVVVLSSVYLIGLAWGRWPRVQTAIQIGLDLALVTWLAAVTGGRQSQFVLFYVLVILCAGVLFDARGGLVAAVLAGAAFGILPWITGGAPLGGWPEGVATGLASPTWPLLTGIFLAVGVLGGYLGWSVRRTSQRLERANREIEEAAREVEQVRLDTERILASMSSGVLTLDRSGSVLHVNPAAADILGVPASSLRGRRCQDALGSGQESLLARLAETLETGVLAHREEVHLKSAGGRVRPIGISTSILTDEHGKNRGAIAVIADLSEIKAAEERMRRAETLAAIGQLSAHIAHEIRNAVVPIAGSVEILQRELVVRGENAHLLEMVSRECDRLNRFVSELLDYVREPELMTDHVCLNDLVRDVLDLLRRHPLGRATRLALDDGGTVLWTQGDQEQLKRAFVNLAQNAVESMDGSGELVVGITSRGPRAAVEFRDRGPGIPPENLKRILEPFFTTKRGGTGLGLAIAARVIERHGGSLSVSSMPGEGTTVTIELTQEAQESLAA